MDARQRRGEYRRRVRLDEVGGVLEERAEQPRRLLALRRRARALDVGHELDEVGAQHGQRVRGVHVAQPAKDLHRHLLDRRLLVVERHAEAPQRLWLRELPVEVAEQKV